MHLERVVSLPARVSERLLAFIKFNGRKIPLPGSAPIRMGAGVLLVIGGILGFLPILGFWMIPLGILFLSVDLHSVRRWRRQIEVRLGRRRQRKREERRSSGLDRR